MLDSGLRTKRLLEQPQKKKVFHKRLSTTKHDINQRFFFGIHASVFATLQLISISLLYEVKYLIRCNAA